MRVMATGGAAQLAAAADRFHRRLSGPLLGVNIQIR